MRLTAGSRLGPFEIVAPLGAGGMGEVWRAHDTRLGRDVALKFLPSQLASSPDRLARFEREARMVAGLAHPNIVVLHSIEEADGVRFLVLELVEGRNLAEQLGPGGLPVDRVLEFAIPIIEALVAAHEKGVIHRDLKPANVMISREGRVKVLDFGLAKAVDVTDVHATQAATMPISGIGQVLGTIPYMAPEQIRGEATDARTDLFAFGVLLYELASGERPFQGATSADLSSAILRDTPLSRVRDGDLARIVGRCLEKNPRDRFQTALDVLNELKRMRTPPKARTADDRTVSIAVMPFANRSGNADDEYFSEGLADELQGVLGRIRGLKVAARSAAARFKGEDPSSIGRALHVAAVVEGSVRKSGNRARITVQLVQAADGFEVWSETYDRTLDDIFAVQDDIAQSVVREVRKKLLGEADDSDAGRSVKVEVAQAVRGRSVDPEAQRLLLQARFMIEVRTGNFDPSIALLKRAIEIDPNFAPAYVTLAQIYSWLADFHDEGRESERETARAYLARAFELDPDLAEAHVLKAWLALSELDWKSAHAACGRAVELDPRNPLVLRLASIVARAGLRMEEAEDFCRRALETDPLSPLALHSMGHTLAILGRLEESIVHYRKALDLAPHATATHASISQNLFDLGRLDEALEEALLEPQEMFGAMARSIALFALGRVEESDRELAILIEKYSVSSSSQIAEVYARRGDVEAMFSWLERAYEERDGGIMEAHGSSPFLPYHADPRWLALMKRIGFDD